VDRLSRQIPAVALAVGDCADPGRTCRRRFTLAVSARPDPRDHLLMRLAGADERRGSSVPDRESAAQPFAAATGRARIARNTGMNWRKPSAGRPPDRPQHGHPEPAGTSSFTPEPARRCGNGRGTGLKPSPAQLRTAGWQVTLLDNSLPRPRRPARHARHGRPLHRQRLRPGHLAALLGVPTFTLFGPQLPELFAPQHPQAAWIEGRPCAYKPCFDYCRFAVPHCIRDLSPDAVWRAIQTWLARPAPAKRGA
jgi:hypothetical protein